MTPNTLAEGGQPRATIVIAKHPTPAVAFAARELQYHIKKISGAVPAVITVNPVAIEEARKLGPLILIGDSEAAREAVGVISFAPQEYMVGLAHLKKKQDTDPNLPEDTIVLWGCDAGLKDFEFTTVPARVESKPGFGNTCRFTENNRPITVTGIDMDPYCGSLEAWVRPNIIPGNAEATILRIPTRAARHILYLQYYVDNDLDNWVRVRYWVWDIGTNQHKHLWSVAYKAEEAEEAKGWCRNWHHILATYNVGDESGLEITLFVDGKHEQQTTLKGANLGGESVDVHIGGYVEGHCSRHNRADFRGDIDEVRISRGLPQPLDPDHLLPAQPHVSDKNTNLLLHFDESDGAVTVKDSVRNQHMIYEHRCRRPGLFEARGSLDAVYDFLERFYGVRWYAPTEIGMVYNPQPTMLAPTAADNTWVKFSEAREASIIRRKPAMVHRDIYTPPIGRSKTFPRRQSDWYMVGPPNEPSEPIPNAERYLWMLRMRMGGTPRAYGHSLPGRCAEYLEEHPAWFAHDGKDPATVLMWYDNVLKRDVPAQMCYTHEPLINTLVKDIYSHFKDKPAERLSCYDRTQRRCQECDPIQDLPRLGSNHTVHSYSLSPADNAIWCQCEACKSQRKDWTIPPPPNGLFSNDTASSYIHNFTRIVAQRVNALPKAWEGQKWIGQTAYGRFAHYPKMEGFTVEPNVCTWLCLAARTLWSEGVQKNDEIILNEWREHVPGEQLAVYLYYLSPVHDTEQWTSHPFRCFPGFCASKVVSLFTKDEDAEKKYIGFKGMAGVHVEMSAAFASFLVDQLELYLTFKLADDPELSGATLIDDFFKDYYDRAAGAMKSLYRDIEHVFTTTPLPVKFTEEMTWGKDGLGKSERMVSYLKLMADAVAATRRTARGFGTARTQTVLAREIATARPMEKPTVYAERVDLFRRGVWNYMLEGYCTYWAKHPGSLRMPLVKLHAMSLVSNPHVHWQWSWDEVFEPFTFEKEFGVFPELLPIPPWWRFASEHGGFLFVVGRKNGSSDFLHGSSVSVGGEEYLRAVADRIGVQIRTSATPGQEVQTQLVEVDEEYLSGSGWLRRLLGHLADLGYVDSTNQQGPIVMILEWTNGFPSETD